MASLRVLVSPNGHHGRKELTAYSVFSDVIEQCFSTHQTIVESNRFVFDPDLNESISTGFAHQLLLFKGLCMISLLFNADANIGATRRHHIPFYKRVLLMPSLSDERQYPGLNVNMSLLGGSFKDNYQKVCEKWGDKIQVTEAELLHFRQKIFPDRKVAI